MITMSDRLMILGVLFVLGAGAYWVAQHPTESELQNARFNQKISTGYEPSTNEVRRDAQVKERGALWPAGIGVLLLGVAWAMTGSGAPLPPAAPPPTDAKKNDKTPS